MAGDGQSPEGKPGEGKKPQNGKTEREKGKQEPGEQEGGDQQPKPGEKGEEPKGNKDSDDEGVKSTGERSPKQDTELAPGVRVDADTWGELPIYQRDLFRAKGKHGIPPRYRDWIDSYYRRLNDNAGGR